MSGRVRKGLGDLHEIELGMIWESELPERDWNLEGAEIPDRVE